MSNKLMSYLPNYYATSKVITDVTNTQDLELKEFSDQIVKTLNEFFIDKSDFTLERWEKELGLPINNSKLKEHRRSIIKSKLRGHGTVTVNLIKNTAESYSNGEVEVIENNPDYSFKIKFVGTKGLPPNLEDLKATIEEIKPAHLAFDLEFTYNTNSYLHSYHLGWLSAFTNKELRTVKLPNEDEGIFHERMANFSHERLEVILHAH
ncbi:putative phage tail protein [Maledivibacter halophilus]|uniref:Uncharacterized protein n=1 Tax=Maledivibacter halophilus TaxID=36842 RepID=A0A1T5M511_9FIRM|nr:putative phage tail protein [Maledivibacter halophilus]SKC82898.1 hypothetical protein SAMN02194393_03772 [Maledivibacter halophilus]